MDLLGQHRKKKMIQAFATRAAARATEKTMDGWNTAVITRPLEIDGHLQSVYVIRCNHTKYLMTNGYVMSGYGADVSLV